MCRPLSSATATRIRGPMRTSRPALDLVRTTLMSRRASGSEAINYWARTSILVFGPDFETAVRSAVDHSLGDGGECIDGYESDARRAHPEPIGQRREAADCPVCREASGSRSFICGRILLDTLAGLIDWRSTATQAMMSSGRLLTFRTIPSATTCPSDSVNWARGSAGTSTPWCGRACSRSTHHRASADRRQRLRDACKTHMSLRFARSCRPPAPGPSDRLQR